MIKKSNLDNKLALLDKQNDTPNNEVYLNNINMDGRLNNNNLGFKNENGPAYLCDKSARSVKDYVLYQVSNQFFTVAC